MAPPSSKPPPLSPKHPTPAPVSTASAANLAPKAPAPAPAASTAAAAATAKVLAAEQAWAQAEQRLKELGQGDAAAADGDATAEPKAGAVPPTIKSPVPTTLAEDVELPPTLKVAPPREASLREASPPPPTPSTPIAAEGGAVCTDYRIDMAAADFGQCKCGRAKRSVGKTSSVARCDTSNRPRLH